MELKRENIVRFCNDGKLYPEKYSRETRRNEKRLPILKPDGSGNVDAKFTEMSSWRRNMRMILDPGSEVSLLWNRIFLSSCLMALFVDPLFLYLPSVFKTYNSSCMATDLNLGITVTCLRTFADLLYLLHVIIKFRIAYVSPQTRVFGRGELVMDPKKIADRYLRSDFFIDAIAMLPLPQIVIWFIIPAIRSSHADHSNNPIVLVVFLQYIPRLYLIFPLSSEIIKSAGLVTKTTWASAVYNLLLYMLASHILGASWYLLSIQRHANCWKSVCKSEFSPLKCDLRFLDCGSLNHQDRITWANNTAVFSKCHPQNSTGIGFQYGIFGDLVTRKVESSEFMEKYFYCLWWGLQNLSSYGQNLKTSTFIGETLFAILIAILGLVLFAHLIGNMQTYLQSMTVRLEEWRLKRRDNEKWMRHRQLPMDLRELLVFDVLFNTSGWQLEESTKNLSCIPCHQIYVEIFNATFVWTLLDG